MDISTFHATLLYKPLLSTLQKAFTLKHDSIVFSARYRVLMEPKQQEIVGYRVFPFASFVNCRNSVLDEIFLLS